MQDHLSQTEGLAAVGSGDSLGNPVCLLINVQAEVTSARVHSKSQLTALAGPERTRTACPSAKTRSTKCKGRCSFARGARS
jgi:hypothetical protein